MANDTPENPFRDIAIYPFVKHNGISLLPSPGLKDDTEKGLKNIKNINSRASDVLLCTTMKSGTHWCHEILSMLLNQTTEYNTKGFLSEINLECFPDFRKFDEMKDPRLFHTHLPYRYLPQKHVENHYKIVYLNRNPKDRWVSQFTFLHGKIGFPDWDWNTFFTNMILKDDFCDGWFAYTKEFEHLAVSKTNNVLKITFEDLKKNPVNTIQKIAEFVAVPFTERFIEEIADKCSYENFKENKFDATNMVHPENKSTLFRKGIIGDWKNWFTVAQNEQFDKLYSLEMADVDVNFIYENNSEISD